MTTDGDARSPVQDRASIEMHSSRNFCSKPLLSIEETSPERPPTKSSIKHGPKPKVSEENYSTSADRWQNVDKMPETNVDVILDNCAVEDCGPDHKTSTGNGQGHMDLSCTGPISDASEDKRKTFDGTRIIDNDSTDLQQDSKDSNTTMSCALENDALIVLLSATIFKENNLAPEGHRSNNSTTIPTAGLGEKNLTPQDKRSNDSTTELSESGHNGDVGCRPNDEKRAFPGACQIVQNASNLKIDDGTNIDDCTTITSSKLQGGGDTENKCAIDLENETSIDHGRDNNDSLCCRSNIKQMDVKEEKSKALDGTSPKDKASAGLQQDVTKDIRPDGHATMILNSEDSFPVVCQTGGNAFVDCIGCNQSTNILKIDVGTNTDAYDRRRSKTKRRRNKCRGDNLSIECNREDNISSCQGKNNNGLKSLNKAPAIEKSPNAFATTSSTNFGKDGNGSVITKLNGHASLSCGSEIHASLGSKKNRGRSSRASKPCNGSKVLRNASNIFRNFKIIMVLIIMASLKAQASPVQKQWQQFQFCRMDGSLMNEVLTIKNTEDRSSEDCTFTFTSVLFFKECSQSGYLVFAENTTCVNMLTEDLTTEDWNMEYGSDQNGDSLPAARGGRLNEKSVREKIAAYTEPADSSAQRLSAEDNTRTAASRMQKQWQLFWFLKTDGSLIDQVLTIKNMKDRSSEDCTFTFTAVPLYKNCSQSGSLVFVKNEACVEMLTEDLTAEDWSMEYGSQRNGDGLPAARGGRLNEKSMRDKIAEYMEPADSSARRSTDEDKSRTAASRMQKQWQQFWFLKTDGSLIDQVLTIKNMKDRSSEDCTFTFTSVPFYKNCSQSGSLVFVKNETCVEMLTEDLTAEDWSMEYGSQRNGDGLPSARGERLNEKSVREKIDEYTEPPDRSAQRPSAEGIVAITAGVGALLLLCLVLLLLYKFCKQFKSWMDKVVRRRRSDTNTSDIPLDPKSSTNGNTNGNLPNGESQSETTVQLLETGWVDTDTTTV